jgi:hypothetical protein
MEGEEGKAEEKEEDIFHGALISAIRQLVVGPYLCIPGFRPPCPK